MKKIPAKYSRCGIKVKCFKCAFLIKDVCKLNKKGIGSCEHKEKHRYIFIVHVPGTQNTRLTRIAKADNFDDVLLEQISFKAELKNQGYHKAEVKIKNLDTTLAGLMKEYLNYISGNGTHAHLNKKLDSGHVGTYKMVFLRFCEAIKKKGFNPEIFDVKNINDDIVEIFHFHVEAMKLSKTTYSKHFVLMKAFINWVIKKKDFKMVNAFEHITLHFAKREKNPITKIEFEKLIQVTTPINGVVNDSSGKKRNRFHPWLTAAFKLGLETGLRREEIVQLSWANVREISNAEKNCYIIDVNNLKNNRRMFGKDTGIYTKPIPVTKGLYNLLIELGYEAKKGSSGYIIEREAGLEVKYMLDEMSRGFAHFIKLVTDRKIEFKDLRKTYITALSVRLGKNTKLFTGHGDDQVMKDSYIAEEFIAANLTNFSVFGEERIIKK
jgi:integrase